MCDTNNVHIESIEMEIVKLADDEQKLIQKLQDAMDIPSDVSQIIRQFVSSIEDEFREDLTNLMMKYKEERKILKSVMANTHKFYRWRESLIQLKED